MAKAERRGLARGRKKQTRAKRKRHLIVSNGRVTETEYFNFLINEMDVRGSVQYRYIDGDPLKVAKKVSREIESDIKAVKAGEIDELNSVWIVVDSDEFRNLPLQSAKLGSKELNLQFPIHAMKYGLLTTSHHALRLLHRLLNVRNVRAILAY